MCPIRQSTLGGRLLRLAMSTVRTISFLRRSRTLAVSVASTSIALAAAAGASWAGDCVVSIGAGSSGATGSGDGARAAAGGASSTAGVASGGSSAGSGSVATEGGAGGTGAGGGGGAADASASRFARNSAHSRSFGKARFGTLPPYGLGREDGGPEGWGGAAAASAAASAAGVSAGASTGAVAVLVLGIGAGAVSLSLGAFVGAFAAFAVVALLSNGATSGPNHTILAGVAASQLFNALTAYIVTTSASAQQARGVMFWMLGSFGGVRWPQFHLLVIVLVLCLAICFVMARALDAFTFGDEDAAALGIPVARTRLILFGVTALMTATIVSQVGAIGFVGLVVPHLVRLLAGPDNRIVVPGSILGGAIVMVMADLVARTAAMPEDIPIGLVLGPVGGPFFLWLLVARKWRGL